MPGICSGKEKCNHISDKGMAHTWSNCIILLSLFWYNDFWNIMRTRELFGKCSTIIWTVYGWFVKRVPPCKTCLMSLSVRNSSMQTLKPTQEGVLHNPFYSHRQTAVLYVAIWGNSLRKLSLDKYKLRAFCCIHWFFFSICRSLDFLEIQMAQQHIIKTYFGLRQNKSQYKSQHNLVINGIWYQTLKTVRIILICSQFDLKGFRMSDSDLKEWGQSKGKYWWLNP